MAVKNDSVSDLITRIMENTMAMNSRILWICIGVAGCLVVIWAISFLKNSEPATDTDSSRIPAQSGTVSDSAQPGTAAQPGTPAQSEPSVPRDTVPRKLSPAEAKRIIEDRARQAITALGAGDMRGFSAFVHPIKGVRFSPYAHIVPGEDLAFRREQVAGLWANPSRYIWGWFDGSGDSIHMSFRDYHKRFIYNYRYAEAERVAYNDTLMGSGNTLNNIREIYPGGIIVEYNFPGQNPKYGGMDWGSLWLAFEREHNEWYVVGVVHDEWTI